MAKREARDISDEDRDEGKAKDPQHLRLNGINLS